MELKKCSKCKVEKDRSEFKKRKQSKDGLQPICKQCNKEYRLENIEHRIEYSKEHYKSNTKQKKEYYEANKEHIKQKRKEYYQKNKAYKIEYNKEYQKDNKEYINARQNEYAKARRKKDSLYRFKLNLRGTVKRYINGAKNNKTEAILGMSFEAFKERIGEYDSSMQLDHIIPLSWAKNEEEIYTLNHYSNFQLLTAEENILKGDRFARVENVRRVFKYHNNKKAIAKIILRNYYKII